MNIFCYLIHSKPPLKSWYVSSAKLKAFQAHSDLHRPVRWTRHCDSFGWWDLRENEKQHIELTPMNAANSKLTPHFPFYKSSYSKSLTAELSSAANFEWIVVKRNKTTARPQTLVYLTRCWRHIGSDNAFTQLLQKENNTNPARLTTFP